MPGPCGVGMRIFMRSIGALAIASLVLWGVASMRSIAVRSGSVFLACDRSGIFVTAYEEDISTLFSSWYGTSEPKGPWWRWPTIVTTESTGIAWSIVVPHWLIAFVTWPVYLALWSRSRKPPRYCCQRCGYDLTGNTTGRCPECNSPMNESEPMPSPASESES